MILQVFLTSATLSMFV